MSASFNKVAILGLGLISSSISHAIRKFGGAKTISGHAKSAETLKVAAELKLADSLHEDACEAVKDADLIILCVPVGTCGPLAKAIQRGRGTRRNHHRRGLGRGSHRPRCGHMFRPMPISFPVIPSPGHRAVGPRAGFAELFQNHWSILTPRPGNPPGRSTGWKASGAASAPMWSG
ncbi:MAG: prephenate dehydrogenase/arogenate dehydrogenase family protein [Hyphomicrobiales bacterium]